MKRTKRQTTIEVLTRAIAHCDNQIRVLTGFDNLLASETKTLRTSLNNRLSGLLVKEANSKALCEIIKSIQKDYSLDVPSAKLLIGVSKKGVQIKQGNRLKTVHGFFYVEELNRGSYKRVLEEAEQYNVPAPYQIYGRFEVLQSPNVNFVNIQDHRRILSQQLQEVS